METITVQVLGMSSFDGHKIGATGYSVLTEWLTGRLTEILASCGASGPHVNVYCSATEQASTAPITLVIVVPRYLNTYVRSAWYPVALAFKAWLVEKGIDREVVVQLIISQ